MKYFYSKYLAISIMIVSGFCFSTGTVHAFSVSRSTIEHVIEPGKLISGSFSVKNETDTIANFDVVLRGFQPIGETGEMDFFSSNETLPELSWFSTQENFLILQPHEVRDFQYTISVPTDASAGGHYVAILFSRAAPQELTTTPTIMTGAKNGVSFFIRVTGAIQEGVGVLDFSSMPSDSFRRLPVSFETRLQNLGNVHVKPSGSVVIKNFLGREVTKLPFNPDSILILPNGTRRFLSTWAKTDMTEQRKGAGWVSSVMVELRNFAFGPYTAEIQAVYGDSEQRLSAKTSFWIVPWSVISVASALLVLLILATRFYNRFLVGRHIRKLNSR